MAKTWATKCCPGTYKNNYQLCCGIKDNVILVGNPVRNKKIKEMFYKIVEEKLGKPQ